MSVTAIQMLLLVAHVTLTTRAIDTCDGLTRVSICLASLVELLEVESVLRSKPR